MHNFSPWTADWFYLSILNHWPPASAIFLAIWPALYGVYVAILIANDRSFILFSWFTIGILISVIYLFCAFCCFIPGQMMLIPASSFLIPYAYADYKKKRKAFRDYALIIAMGVLLFFVDVIFMYLAWMYYRIAVYSIEFADMRMAIGIKIGTAFLLFYSFLYAVSWFKNRL